MSSLALIALAVSGLAPGRLSNDGGRCVRFRYGAGRREDYGAGSHKEWPSSDSTALSIFDHNTDEDQTGSVYVGGRRVQRELGRSCLRSIPFRMTAIFRGL